MKSLSLVPFAFVIAACQPAEEFDMAEPAFAPVVSQDLVTVAKAALNQWQPASFREEREYCGYIVRLPDGAYSATQANRGDENSCEADEPDFGLTVVASYHTHGAFHEDALAEVPSSSDLEADAAEGVDGFVSTPGGRLWAIDGRQQVATQLCGIGCMIQDGNFRAGFTGPIAQSYTLRGLQQFEQG